MRCQRQCCDADDAPTSPLCTCPGTPLAPLVCFIDQVLAKVEICKPHIPVYSSVTAKPFLMPLVVPLYLLAPPTQVLAQVEIRKPRIPVYSNVTAEPFPGDPDGIRGLLARQLLEPVLWENTLRNILAGEGVVALIMNGNGQGGSGVWSQCFGKTHCATFSQVRQCLL